MLCLLLAFVLVFAYWLRSLHRLEAQWDTRGRGLEQLDVGGDSVAH
jgi:hypothetical protein